MGSLVVARYDDAAAIGKSTGEVGTMKKSFVAASVVGLSLLLAGCISAGVSSSGEDARSDVASSAPLEIKHKEDWKDAYPDVYASFMSGADELKDYVDWNGEQSSHSHASYMDKIANIDKNAQRQENGNNGMRCVACKSADIPALFEKYGDSLWNMKYSELSAAGECGDFWGCYQCHENEPGVTLKPTSVIVNTAAPDWIASYEPGTAVCAQCHNIMGRYMRSIVDQGMNTLETMPNPYRYGTDPDSLYKAQMEDGAPTTRDDDGVEYFKPYGCYDAEVFQGGNHQSLGLTCASCHMPTSVNEDGETYINHNASGSPLKKQESLELCLTCHKSQGIETTDDMISFVKDTQETLAAKHAESDAALQKLHDLIVAGTDDKNVDEQARELYKKASWYQGYVSGDEGEPGVKAAHAFDKMVDYHQLAIDTANEGIALFK